jgi:DNA-binding NtrC family response regulator
MTASSANAANSAAVPSVGGSARPEEIRSDNGPPGGSSELTGPVRPLAEANRAFERRTIEAALLETGGNKTRAAKRLGVPLRTFMDKIKRYGL